MSRQLYSAPINIRKFLILLLAGKRTIVLNAKIDIVPYDGITQFIIRGNDGLFNNLKTPMVNGMVIEIEQFDIAQARQGGKGHDE